MKRVCVFCGSSSGGPEYAELARDCGRVLAQRGLTLVYGGGNVGLMGVLADAVLDAGGEVIGVIPNRLVDRELAHNGLTSLIRVGSMHERKQRMAELSDGSVALPGGIGTMDELFVGGVNPYLGIPVKSAGFFSRVLDAENFLHAISS